jgi:8-oxo-dGTP pyrophosphatase MutT (NUDIX family)
MNSNTPTPIYSAGGIIERMNEGKIQILLVNRNRYNSDWSFPKGKVEGDESLEETLQREVKEETGFTIEKGDFVGSICYPIPEGLKITYYWKARIISGEFAKNDEVKGIKWVSPEVAVQRLSYEDLKALVNAHYTLTIKPKPLIWWIDRILFRIVGSSNYDRLKNEIIVMKQELDSGLQLDQDKYAEAQQILSLAESEMEDLNYEGAWRNLNLAKEIVARAYPRDRQNHMVTAIKHEAKSKLGGWRLDTVKEILQNYNNVEDLVYAMKVMEDQFTNLAFKARLKVRQITFILTILILELLVIFLMSDSVFPKVSGINDGFDSIMVLPVMLFGTIGATFNGIISVAKAEMRIPMQKANYRYQLIRIILGGITGLIIYLFICANLVNVINIESTHLERVIIYSFIAGFSEDYLVELMSRARGK